MSSIVRVYLDSSDYSDLANEGEKSEELAIIYKKLASYIEEGKVEVYYSIVTILECVQTAKIHKHRGLSRAKVIEEFSRGKCFRPFLELYKAECKNYLIKNGIIKSGLVPAEAGHNIWYPDLLELVQEFDDMFVDAIRTELSELPRFSRKPLEKKIFRKGRVDFSVLRQIGLSDSLIIENINNSYPTLSGTGFDELFCKLISGEINKQQFMMKVGNKVFSPVEFSRNSLDLLNVDYDKLNWLRNVGAKLNDVVTSSRLEFHDLIELGNKLKVPKNKIKEMEKKFALKPSTPRRIILNNVYKSNKEYWLNQGVDESRWSKIILSSEIGSFSGIDLFCSMAGKHFTNKIRDRRAKLNSSDHGDLQHLNYAPYVDIFRADKRMSVLLERENLPERVQVAPSLKKLMEMLESRIS